MTKSVVAALVGSQNEKGRGQDRLSGSLRSKKWKQWKEASVYSFMAEEGLKPFPVQAILRVERILLQLL